MASSVIGALRVNLGLDSAQFVKGAANAQSTMQKMSLKMVAAGAAITAAIGGAVFELVKMTRATINVADEISKSAVKIGIGTEELSRLRYAADLSGVSFEQLEKGLLILNRNMAGIGGQSKIVSEAFAQMGIETRNADGSLKSSTEVLKEMAEVFKTMPDGAQKSALAMSVLGRSGGDMIPLLNGGAAALQELTDEADRFGIVIDAETGRRAELFNDNLTRLQGTFEALSVRIASQLLPHLIDFTEWLIRNQEQIVNTVSKVGEFISGVARLAQGVANAVAWMEERFGSLTRAIGRAVGPLATLINLTARFGSTSAATRGAVGETANAMLTMGRQAVQNAQAMRSLGNTAGDTGERISRGVGGGSRVASGALNALQRDAENTARQMQSLMDRLFPAVAAARKMREELALIEGSALGEEEKASARFRLRTEDLGQAAVSKSLLDTGPLIDKASEEANRTLEVLAKKAETQTVRIAQSFADMTRNVVSSLQGLTNSIRSGDFLGILGGVIDIFAQLGSAGVFGGGVQARFNAPSFAGGGFTGMGSRTGGLDGKGGFMAMLHPQETVIDHTRGQGGGSRVEVVPSPYFNVVVDGRIVRSAPAVANAGAQQAQALSARSARRRVR